MSKKPFISTRNVYLWHRYLGVTAAVFVVLLAISGLLLNHTAELQLARQYVRQDWLLSWYGIEAGSVENFFPVSSGGISQTHDYVYFNNRRLFESDAELLGAVQMEEMLVLAQPDSLTLLTDKGELIEKIGAVEGLPQEVQMIGVSANGSLLLKTAKGIYRGDNELTDWQPATADGQVLWSRSEQPTEQQRRAILRQELNMQISLERLLLDVHSGRFFGSWGPWVMDIAALLMLFLAVSGPFLWLRLKVKRKHR